MLSTEKLISAAHAMHIIREKMMEDEYHCGLNSVEDNAVFLTYPEFCRRFPDRSAWTFKAWPADFDDYVGEQSVNIQGVKFFALEPKEEK